MRRQRRRRQRSQAWGCRLTVALLILSYPPFDQGWLAWLSLVPALYAWRGTQRTTGLFVPTFLAGLFWGGGLFYPLLAVEGGTWIERTVGFVAVTGGMASLLAVFLLLSAWSSRGRAITWYGVLGGVLVNAALWVSLEYLMRHIATGFSVYLGITQWRLAWAMNVAPYAGIHGVGALVVGVNAALADAVLWMSRRKRGPLRRRAGWPEHGYAVLSQIAGGGSALRGSSFVALGIVLIVTVLTGRSGIPGYSETVLSGATSSPSHDGSEFTAVMIQPNWSAARYEAAAGTMAAQQKLVDDVLTLTERALSDVASTEPVLVIWPETTLHIAALDDQDLRLRITGFARSRSVSLLVGFPRLAHAEHDADPKTGDLDPRKRNSAFLIAPNGNVTDIYDKVYVIPIAEHQYAPGAVISPFALSGNRGAPVGVGICSDVVEPAHALASARAGAASLHYISSLGRIGRIALLERAFLAFRAAEHGLYVTQTATTGPTLVVGPDGRIVAEAPVNEAAGLVAAIHPREAPPTFYTRWGDWPALVAGLLLCGLGVGGFVQRARN